MARNIIGLKRGGPGRPKGVPNKATHDIKEFCRAFLESPDYVESAKRRVRAGKAPHLESLWFHYGYGKPRETYQIEGGVVPLVIDELKRDD